MIISKPKIGEYGQFAQKYIDNLPNDINLIDHLISNLNEIILIIEPLSEEQLQYRYDTDKWTIKEVLGHIIDGERVFCYRALAYARGDKALLPGFDENDYAKSSNVNDREIADIIDELKTVRLATISLFKSFKIEYFSIVGKTTENNLSISALAFIILGHAMHHIKIINERYLN